MNGNYYVTSIKQYQDNLRDLFYGFDHYRIPLELDNYRVEPENFHLSQEAVEILLNDLAKSLNQQGYLE